jgi:hypothetical protein
MAVGGKRPPRAPIWPSPRATAAAAHARSRLLAIKARLGRFWLVLPLLLAFVLLAGFGAGFALWSLSQTITNYPGSHFNTGQNAIWLEHDWSGSPHSPADYDTLAARLQTEQVSYVYAHVGPLESDGRIPADRAPFARDLADALHTRLPDLHVLAWIGQLEAASGQPAGGVVNLQDSAVRSRIAATAAHFVVDERFAGVHYDIEPILNNNNHFLDLLDETRAALPPGATLSIAAEKWAPNATVATWANDSGHASAWWTSYYFAAVAGHVDQMAVMAYNTAMPTAQLYQLFVKEQVQHILEAVQAARHPPQLLVGVPTYPGDDRWHHAGAENMASGLAGIAAGLNSTRDPAPFAGVAIYRFGLTTNGDWATYDKAWLGK